jgi:hypothetical protein
MTTTELGQSFISHFGVKGMKWGQRKAPPAPIEAKVQSVVTSNKFSKTKIKGEGGHNHPATEDALKVATVRQKLKTSGPAALSNKELQDVATRMNLEQQVSRLESNRPRQGLGRQAVGKLLKDPNRTIEGTRTAAKEINLLLNRK